ncbi:MAG: hypothetical protein AMXMBFR82_52480 [Candidatus Hydrogenedentota bacterium]
MPKFGVGLCDCKDVATLVQIRAFEELAGKLCNSAGAGSLRDVFVEPVDLDTGPPYGAILRHTEMLCSLLTDRTTGEVLLEPDVRVDLLESHDYPAIDAWGNPYLFYMPSRDGSPRTEVEKLILKSYGGPDSLSAVRSSSGHSQHLVFIISCGPDGRVQYPLGAIVDGAADSPPPEDDITNLGDSY